MNKLLWIQWYNRKSELRTEELITTDEIPVVGDQVILKDVGKGLVKKRTCDLNKNEWTIIVQEL